jgi:protocatechuate 3,4-dioxygenase beta subunit
MPKPIISPVAWTRRQTIIRLATTALTWPLWGVGLGCGAASIVSKPEDSLPTNVVNGGANGGNLNNVEPTPNAIDPSKWATGGTTQLAKIYADPFGSSNGTECMVTCHGDDGPCALGYGASPQRQDISEGVNGLPMYLALQILDPQCTPVANATVEVWHSSPSGLYSGDTRRPGRCQNNDSTAQAAMYFRGNQVTGDDGKVQFYSCFPGWVPQETLRIYVRIAVDKDTWLTTQMTFDDAIADGIIATQPIYKERGARDTNNQNDPTLSSKATQTQQLNVLQMPDGAMMAYKSLVLRASLADFLCDLPAPEPVTEPAMPPTPVPTPVTEPPVVNDPNGM